MDRATDVESGGLPLGQAVRLNIGKGAIPETVRAGIAEVVVAADVPRFPGDALGARPVRLHQRGKVPVLVRVLLVAAVKGIVPDDQRADVSGVED